MNIEGKKIQEEKELFTNNRDFTFYSSYPFPPSLLFSADDFASYFIEKY